MRVVAQEEKAEEALVPCWVAKVELMAEVVLAAWTAAIQVVVTVEVAMEGRSAEVATALVRVGLVAPQVVAEAMAAATPLQPSQDLTLCERD